MPADWDREQVIEAAERALRGASSPGLQFLKDLTVQDAEPADGDDEDAEYGGEA
ncbi:hypothetical protein [Trebonia kvetii]|uniref:hypothetical protein n=1 Tax=Trebonia kvetii TaxID=2480626 RepID=UPI001C9E4D18|nr:hypothetical protein [Trebonia kvetii]